MWLLDGYNINVLKGSSLFAFGDSVERVRRDPGSRSFAPFINGVNSDKLCDHSGPVGTLCMKRLGLGLT